MPLQRCTLLAHDWLYIPRGYWHRTEATSESISLSVGVRTAVALDVFDFLRCRLVDSLRWRQRLPVHGAASALSGEELAAQYRELLADLAQDLGRELSQEQFVKDFLARPPEGR
jgi:ribosomal protein L16 Arg81 hydroxylase